MATEFVLLLILLKPTEVFVSIFREKKYIKSPKNLEILILFFQDDMFAACKEKPKKPNMPLQNVISLPSIGHFVDEVAL